MKVGDEIGTLEQAPDAVDLFLYSAAAWAPHRIHYDLDYARSEGHAGLVVHGPLQAAYLARLASEFAATHGCRVRSLRFRHVGALLAGTRVVCRGRVTAIAGPVVTCELWVERAETGERTTEGSAVLEPSAQAPLR